MNEKLARLRALLVYTDKQQSAISDEYSQCLGGDIPFTLRIQIKNYLENARSLLDYMANDICVDVLRLSEKHKCYFPLHSHSKDEFVRFCRINFPELASAAPDVYSALESIQPFHTAEFSVLKLLAEYTNENKHRDLSAQHVVKETHAASRFRVIRFGDIGMQLPTNGICDGFLVADETGLDPFLGSDYVVGNIGNIIELSPDSFRYTSFKFANSGEDVIVTLIEIQGAISRILERLIFLYERPISREDA